MPFFSPILLNNFSDRTVYFHALSSLNEFSVPNYVLQNETWATNPASYGDYQYIGSRGPRGQSTTEQIDLQSNVMFYTQVNKDSIQCWNTNKIYNEENQGIVDSDTETLVFPNDLKIDDKGTMYVLSDRMPIFLFKKLDKNDINYRVLTGKVSDLILGTPCEQANP